MHGELKNSLLGTEIGTNRVQFGRLARGGLETTRDRAGKQCRMDWISKQAQPTEDKVQSIQEALASSNQKDLPAAKDSELKMICLDGSEVGLLGIHRLVREGKAILRSGDGRIDNRSRHECRRLRAEDGKDLYVKVGRANEGTSSTKPETGALSLALNRYTRQE
jgi:hypothetical protein